MILSRSCCHSRLSSPGGTPVPVMLRSAISWIRKRHIPRGTYSGGGCTWHFVHCCLTISATFASSSGGSGTTSRVRAGAPAGGDGGREREQQARGSGDLRAVHFPQHSARSRRRAATSPPPVTAAPRRR